MPDLRTTASRLAVAAGLRASAETVASTVRRAAAERFDTMRVDWAGLARLDGDAADEAGAVIGADIEGQVEWWRERLREQGHGHDQVERLVSEYRRAAMRDFRRRLATAQAGR